MKIKSIVSICKKERRFWICQEKENKTSVQWLGDSSALYMLSKIPQLDKENIFTIFDIPAKQAEKMDVTKTQLPERFDFRDVVEYENMLEWEELTLSFGGKKFLPIHTCKGLKFINEKYLKPLSDLEPGMLELYERTTEDGQMYIAAKNGFTLLAIILPFEVDEKIGKKIKKFAQDYEFSRERE